MTAETVLYIIIAGVASFALALFMYGYKTKYNRRLSWLFGVLRFVTLFALFLLLINPKFTSKSFTLEKPKLPVLVDVSSSISSLGGDISVTEFVNNIKNNDDLYEKFDISFYGFGDNFSTLDSVSFNDKQTNIDGALKQVKSLFKANAPTVLITDGNQTFGSDYEFSSLTFPNAIYPVIVGDSTQYIDLKIAQLNTNRYSFLKNEFPIEAILVYNGKENVSSRFVIRQGGSTIYSENINFSEVNNSQTVTLSLPSTNVGLQRYTATIEPISEEKNTTNNSKLFAVEVIDQATSVLIVSKIKHPDLGALKKAIETNEQRKVTFLTPEKASNVLNNHQLIILYQPDRSFTSVFSEMESLKKNAIIISGLQTDWNFLNSAQEFFRKEATNVQEDIYGLLNLNYGSYAVDDIGFSEFPPLETQFGTLEVIVPHEVLLQQQVNGFTTGSPLMASVDINGVRASIWDGEGIWKWRANSYLNAESFQDFDEFIGKIVQYLASNKRKSRLEVNHETFYYNNNPILIAAQYFDKSFAFDSRAQLEIRVRNLETNLETVFPLLLKNNYYEVDLNSLPQGDYSFTISVKDEAVSRSGNFTILDFNIEQQFLNANVTKLRRLATNTGAVSYFIADYDALLNSLLSNENYKAIERSQQKVVPLIDWKYLLALIALMLSSEWIIRKYNGLI